MAGHYTGKGDTLRVPHVETGTVQVTTADDTNTVETSYEKGFVVNLNPMEDRRT